MVLKKMKGKPSFSKKKVVKSDQMNFKKDSNLGQAKGPGSKSK